MRFGKLNKEINSIGMVNNHHIFAPKKMGADEVFDEAVVETAAIYIKDKISLLQAIDELEKTCLLDHSYAAITNTEERMIYITDIKGRRLVRYLGKTYSSLTELVEKTDMTICRSAIKQINLSFNIGSYHMIFG